MTSLDDDTIAPTGQPSSTPILFSKTTKGDYASRIDDLEVTLRARSFDIVAFEHVYYTPCDTAGDECPERRLPPTCDLIHNCPFEYTQETCSSHLSEGGYTSFHEVEAKIRDILGRQRGHAEAPVLHKKLWPEPAASSFANQPWIFYPSIPEHLKD